MSRRGGVCDLGGGALAENLGLDVAPHRIPFARAKFEIVVLIARQLPPPRACHCLLRHLPLTASYFLCAPILPPYCSRLLPRFPPGVRLRWPTLDRGLLFRRE